MSTTRYVYSTSYYFGNELAEGVVHLKFARVGIRRYNSTELTNNIELNYKVQEAVLKIPFEHN
jgi:hypothetical protein